MNLIHNTNQTLANKNIHPRDQQIKFYEEGHKYTILHDETNTYTSVTTWIHSHFPKFDADSVIKNMMKGKNWGPANKYWGLTPLEIKTSWTNNGKLVSEAGTKLHYEIECFMNNDTLIHMDYTHKDLLSQYNPVEQTNISIEWEYFIQFIRDFPDLKPYRTEWMIYDEDIKIAGSVDMIYENHDGTLSIYDWKRSKDITKINTFNKVALTRCICHLPDSNFWHYALQLNIYRMILEKKYDKKVKELFLVKLHPNNESNNYEIISVPIMTKELDELLELRQDIMKKTSLNI